MEGTTLTTTAECDTPQPICQMEKGYAHELRLETEVSGNQEGGILVWHTGNAGNGRLAEHDYAPQYRGGMEIAAYAVLIHLCIAVSPAAVSVM